MKNRVIFFFLAFCGCLSAQGQFPRYQLIQGDFNWFEAKLDAEKRGGHLATITSQKEWDDIRALIPASVFLGKAPWIGGIFNEVSKRWEWITGEPWGGFTNWRGGEPNGIGGGCVSDHILMTELPGSPWNDECNTSKTGYYLLEYEFPLPVPRYQLVEGNFTWYEAKADAEKRGGHLATITSQKEWDRMVTLLGNAFKGGLWWLGANNDNLAKEWRWVTGEIWGYTRWASPSEPSGVGGKGPENYLLTWGAGNEFWNDGTGLDRRGYILEVDSPPNTYELIQGTFTWKEAKLDAERRGGHLATITSQQEWDAVVTFFGNNLLGVFLGGTDEQKEGVWEWITGEPWNFQNWAGGQPDNSSGAQHYLWLHPAYSLKWDDSASALGSESKYLLEIESPPNPPVIQPQPPLINAFTLSRLAFSQIQGLRIPLSPPDRAAFTIETSVDFKTWSPVITFPTNSGSFEFIDSSAVGHSMRFYRAIRR